jgi:glycosyltransferase involved in cell wall biosynthesis
MYNLALTMIVKNEAPNIKRFLESVAPYINYYVIADTGSIDDTKKIIKEYFDEKGIPGEILDHKWEDFGTNRSKVLKHCHGKVKWALMIDADDTIEGKLPIEKFDDNLDGYVVKIMRGSMVWYRAQIFNLGKKLWWFEEPLHEYAICEQPMNVSKLEGDYSWNVRTEGCRSREVNSDREKYARDYFTLKKYLEIDPQSVRKQFYAAQSAFDAQLYEVAEKEYLKRVEMGNWPEEIFYSWIRIGICREIMGKPLSEIAEAFMSAYEARPNRAEALYHLSCVYRKHERPRSAFLVASQALTIPAPTEDILFVDHSVYQWGILDEIATTAFYVGKIHMGLSACEKLLNDSHMPEVHRERIQKNKDVYLKAVSDFNEHKMKTEQERVKKIDQSANKTTLSVDLKKLETVKL